MLGWPHPTTELFGLGPPLGSGHTSFNSEDTGSTFSECKAPLAGWVTQEAEQIPGPTPCHGEKFSFLPFMQDFAIRISRRKLVGV